MPVQHVPLSVFAALEAGDILFVDSTHVVRTGSDVCFELFEVLPCLARGVLVHIHDMFWPFEYSRQWAVEENRSWNELYAVRAFLSYNDAWRIVLFNDYLAKLERGMIEATYPQFLRSTGGALCNAIDRPRQEFQVASISTVKFGRYSWRDALAIDVGLPPAGTAVEKREKGWIRA